MPHAPLPIQFIGYPFVGGLCAVANVVLFSLLRLVTTPEIAAGAAFVLAAILELPAFGPADLPVRRDVVDVGRAAGVRCCCSHGRCRRCRGDRVHARCRGTRRLTAPQSGYLQRPQRRHS